MINHHIDLSVVLRRTVCDLYSDLVTRPTGAAVRTGIEQVLEELGERTLTVIDFARVGLLDFSCADEIVAKLLLRHAQTEQESGREAFFVFRGLDESHLDAIEAVLGRHRLAMVAQLDDGHPVLVGTVSDAERRAWNAMRTMGHCDAEGVAEATGMSAGDAAAVLDALWKRRLAMRIDGCYLAVGAAT